MLDVTGPFYAGVAYMGYQFLKCAVHVFRGPVWRDHRTGKLRWGRKS